MDPAKNLGCEDEYIATLCTIAYRSAAKFPLTEPVVRGETARRRSRLMNWVLTFEAAKARAISVLKAIYLTGLFALAMGLFCGEFPESLRLVDDTTNDYVADSSASAARENETVRETEFGHKQTTPEEHIAAPRWRTERILSASLSGFESTEPAPISGQELLPFLSIRRT